MDIRKIIRIVILAVMAFAPSGSFAVESNISLWAEILDLKNRQEDALETQRRIQLIEAEGSVFTGRVVQATNEYLREFNDYLDSFQGVVCIAAELYGIYSEVKQTVKLTGQVSSIISSAPSNSIALLMKPNERGIYTAILNTSLEAAQDLYKACIAKQKMTEAQRQKILDGARTKIKEVNRMLTRLCIVLKYTTFESLWKAMQTRASLMCAEKKHLIVERCFGNWKNNIR